jgi:hypothetical protein
MRGFGRFSQVIGQRAVRVLYPVSLASDPSTETRGLESATADKSPTLRRKPLSGNGINGVGELLTIPQRDDPQEPRATIVGLLGTWDLSKLDK